MARIAGVNIPDHKHAVISLTYVYGIGRSIAAQVLDEVKLPHETKMGDFSEEQLDKIREVLKKYRIEGDLRREVTGNIKNLQDIGTYRGSRHRKRLPTRGQRTKTNARTRKGRAVTIQNKKK
ncbi:30S ribosomal protein S13 [Candidatus Gracilibacteria bacterium]|nr:MAG: 30S ribosomal protein S13 [Candidatus Gracilibacteria bacterium]